MGSDAQRTGTPPSIADLNFADMALDPAQLDDLVGTRGECVLNWSTRDGDPVGVVVAYVYRQGRFWMTSSAHRKRVAALRSRPRASVVVNRDGMSATFKGDAHIHDSADDDWAALKSWFLPALSGTEPGSSDPAARAVLNYLDAPHQVIIEIPVQLVVSFDFARFGSAMRAGIAGAP
jgi:hypothetical protein